MKKIAFFKKGAACFALAFAAVLGLAIPGNGESLSLTTGMPTDKPYKPVMVNLDNEPAARPQIGLAAADVVYEMVLYEGGYTRYTAVYNDRMPEYVEGVRSARICHVDLYNDWGGAFVFNGVQEKAGTDTYEYIKKGHPILQEWDGIKSTAYYSRDESRESPHNVRFALAQAMEATKFEKKVKARSPLRFDAENPTRQGDDVTEFAIPYRVGSYHPSYLYDAEKDSYRRYYNGRPMNDGISKTPITCQNVIVMTAKLEWYDEDDERPLYTLTGGGACTYFTGGKRFEGSWKRDKGADVTQFLDAEGNEVRFTPGKTFIQIVPEGQRIDILG